MSGWDGWVEVMLNLLGMGWRGTRQGNERMKPLFCYILRTWTARLSWTRACCCGVPPMSSRLSCSMVAEEGVGGTRKSYSPVLMRLRVGTPPSPLLPLRLWLWLLLLWPAPPPVPSPPPPQPNSQDIFF